MALRSPNYPSLSLEAALKAIEPAYKAEGRNKMAKIALAQHLGYSSINGRSLGKMGAVRAYGLISGLGDEVRVTEDAMICLRAPEGSDALRQALERCATRPSLFKSIRADFPDGLPSVGNLTFWLIKNGYTERAAGKAAEAYLATMRLVANRDIEIDPQDGASVDTEDDASDFDMDAPPRLSSALEAARVSSPRAGTRQFVINLPEGGDAVLTYPAGLSREGYQDLQDYLELFFAKAKRLPAEGA